MPTAVRVPTVEDMSTETPTPRSGPAGATAVQGRHRNPLSTVVRNVGIVLDTAARVIFLGRDGVRY
ncbi:hypothetical protein SAMN06272789_2755 [Streptomyces sp. 1331.2]|nr:hypothetical protein SAMN06272789_2755 [Streptomyces sp. 1331.2]